MWNIKKDYNKKISNNYIYNRVNYYKLSLLNQDFLDFTREIGLELK